MRDSVQNVMVAITGLLLLVMIMSLYVDERLPVGDPPWAVSNLSDARARTALRLCTRNGGLASVTHRRTGGQSLYDIRCQPTGERP
jgi:hypothetical protein